MCHSYSFSNYLVISQNSPYSASWGKKPFESSSLYFQYLQDASDFLKQKAEHQDLALAEMRKYREIVLKELSNTRLKLEKALKENER